MTDGTLIVDIESHSSNLLYSMDRYEFCRLMGYKWLGEDHVYITTDLDELIDAIESAQWIIGHNIHAFDLKAIFGYKSNRPLELTMQDRVFDTWTHAVLVNPAPYQYINRLGKSAYARKPEEMLKWFSLDEQAHQLGVAGKTDDLKVLAKEFEDPELEGKDRKDSGFGRIPVDDERYREYLKGDVLASEKVARELLKLGGFDSYARREQNISARAAVISSNGFRTDVEAATKRVEQLRQRREEIMADLVKRYDFPTEGKKPWDTKPGKAAIVKALQDAGVDPNKGDWPQGKTGPSLGGAILKERTEGTTAEELGIALAELKGQRSLAQLALDCTHPDGFVHPDITMLQKSGRWSTTNPGLTVWTARGDGAVEKEYFIPDEPDEEVLLEFDYSNADARMVAAYSGDEKYAERFAPGADGHEINAVTAWGRAKYDSDPKYYRQLAKPGGHGWGYRIGATKLSKTWGLPVTEAKNFLDRMNQTYTKVVGWQNRAVWFANQHGYVVNDWGRKMPVERDRSYTQAPALLGQSGTREIVCDAILALPIWALRKLKAQIHDALVFSVPKKDWEKWRDFLLDLMTTSFKPQQGGQLIEFPVESGPPGRNWYEAGH